MNQKFVELAKNLQHLLGKQKVDYFTGQAEPETKTEFMEFVEEL
jgi:hypothetical protein